MAEWWTSELNTLLTKRNQVQVDPFTDLIHSNTSLLAQVKRFQEQLATKTSSTTEDRKHLELQTQVSSLQSELSKQYKTQAQDSTYHLQLASDATSKQQENQALKHQISSLATSLQEQENKSHSLLENNEQLQHENQVLSVELQRTRSLLERAEKENEQLRRDNATLLHERLDEKARFMTELNQMNQLLAQKQQPKATSTPNLDLEEVSIEDASPAEVPIESSILLPTKKMNRFPAHATEINSLRFNSSGAMLFTASSDASIRLWDTRSCQTRSDFKLASGHAIMAVDLTTDGEFVIGGSSDRTCRVWQTSTARLRHTLTGHAGKVFGVAYCPTTKLVATGSSDRTIKLWDLNRGYCTSTLSCRSTCLDVDAASSGNDLVSGHQDGAVKYWDTRTGQETSMQSHLHQHQVTCVTYSRDQVYLLTTGRDNMIHITDTRTQQVVQSLNHVNYRVTCNWSQVTWSPDGHYVAAGSANNVLYIWNVNTGELVRELEGHGDAIMCVAWSEHVVTADRNGVVMLWK